MLRATLLGPFDGLVTKRLHEPGDTVTIGTTVLRVADTSHVYVRAALDETGLPKLTVGQNAEIRFPGDLDQVICVGASDVWLDLEAVPDERDRILVTFWRAFG